MSSSPFGSLAQALAVTQRFHSPTVTGRRPSAKGGTVTRKTGCSVGSSLLPMVNVPPGRSTISGHCSHSRNTSYGLIARDNPGSGFTATTATCAGACPVVAGGSTGGSGGGTAAGAARSGRRGAGMTAGASAGRGGSGGTTDAAVVCGGRRCVTVDGFSAGASLLAFSLNQLAVPPTARPKPTAIPYAIQLTRAGRAATERLGRTL